MENHNLKAQLTTKNATYWNFIFANKMITINNIPSRTSPNFACGTIFVSLCIELKMHYMDFLYIYFFSFKLFIDLIISLIDFRLIYSFRFSLEQDYIIVQNFAALFQ